MRVYTEVQPSWLGLALHRVNRELRKHAPAGVTFAETPDAADLQILHVIGMGSLEYLSQPALRADSVLLPHD